MKEKGEPILQNLLFFIGGLALIFLAHTGIEEASPTTSLALEVAGFALAGYAPIRLLMSLRRFFSEGWRKRIVEHAFRGRVKVVSPKVNLPILIVAGAHCVTPPFDEELDLRKFQRLRAYCEFIQTEDGEDYPPLLIVTGRSQGYARMLSQSLGMVEGPLDLPFVIENGTALYFPVSRRTVPLVNEEQRRVIEKARGILVRELPNNEFEPKTYMITISPLPYQQTIRELEHNVVRILTRAKLVNSLSVTAFVASLDITPKDINKLSGFKAAIQEYYNLRMDRWEPVDQGPGMAAIVEPALKKTVGIAAGLADLCVLKEVGTAYCSAYNVDPSIIGFVTGNCEGKANVIGQEHIDAVLTVIERECGLRIV
jgi:hypothetical protein